MPGSPPRSSQATHQSSSRGSLREERPKSMHVIPSRPFPKSRPRSVWMEAGKRSPIPADRSPEREQIPTAPSPSPRQWKHECGSREEADTYQSGRPVVLKEGKEMEKGGKWVIPWFLGGHPGISGCFAVPWREPTFPFSCHSRMRFPHLQARTQAAPSNPSLNPEGSPLVGIGKGLTQLRCEFLWEEQKEKQV